MGEDWLKIDALFGKPGSDTSLGRDGVAYSCRIDPGADVSFVDSNLVDRVYAGTEAEYREVVIRSLTGRIEGKLVSLVVGLKDTKGSLVTAQVDCAVVDNLVGPRLGGNVLSHLGLSLTVDYKQNLVSLQTYNWLDFEDDVASLYRQLGAKVRQNVNLAGFQIDIVAEEQTASKQSLRFAVECKYYREKVGNRVVNDFARVAETLKENSLIDRGVIVSPAGFTQDASLVGQQTGIDLLTIADIRQAVDQQPTTEELYPPKKESPRKKRKPKEEQRREEIQREPESKRISTFFVLMPFAPELEDVYHLGIREVVRDLGASCERADEMQYTGGIIEKIYASILSSDAVIAEVTSPNPNVYYEIGYAHALGKPVVLLTKEIHGTPFDLRGYNHVVYSSIIDLRKRLTSMLQQLKKAEGDR